MEKPVQTNDMPLEASVKSRPKLVFPHLPGEGC